MAGRYPGRERVLALAGAAILGLGLLSCGGGGSWDGGFNGSYTAGAVATADLDGDGRADLLNTLSPDWSSDGFLAARIQDPARSGGFRPPIDTVAGTTAWNLALGRLGAVVVMPRDGSRDGAVWAYPPDPARPGAFLRPTALAIGARDPWDAAVGDLDGSGLEAVAVAAAGGTDLLLFAQGPAGAFGAPVSLDVGGTPNAVAIGDLDGDGRPDLAVALAENRVAVLLQDPAHPGAFLPHVDYPVGVNPLAVRIADLDGDGRPDLVTANYGTAHAATLQGLTVLLQDPAGGGVFTAGSTYGTGDYGACAVAAGDLDGDGRPDLVVADYGLDGTTGSVAVLLQDPAHPGAFLAPALYPGGYGPSSVAIADLDGDGRPDLAVADGAVTVRFQVDGQPGVFGLRVAYPN